MATEIKAQNKDENQEAKGLALSAGFTGVD